MCLSSFCGLLAKWLRVRVRVRVRAWAWARECTNCIFFSPSGLISVVNTFVFGGSVSARDGLLMDIQ